MALSVARRQPGSLLIKYATYVLSAARSPSKPLRYLKAPSSSSSRAHSAANCTAHNMRDWAEWEATLDRNYDGSDPSGLTDGDVMVAPTPHPATASAAERVEWEAVLSAMDTAAVPPQQPTETSKKTQMQLYAVIECGSHSTRLLLSTGCADVERLTVDTHLGSSTEVASLQPQQQQLQLEASMDKSPVQQAAVAATLDALRKYRGIIDQYTIASIAAVATAAVREAANAESFQVAASNILGCQLQVLSGAAEGRFAFCGATASLAASGCYCLVFDLGGGSTEVAVGTAGHAPDAVCSIPLGCLGIKAGNAGQTAAALPAAQDGSQQHIDSQQVLSSAQQIVSSHADLLQTVQLAYQAQQQHSIHQLSQLPDQQVATEAVAAQPATKQSVIIGTGGTITTVAALLQQMPQYSHEAVHMSRLQLTDVQQFMQDLATQQHIPRLLTDYSWLTEARASSLLPGCAGILAVMQHFRAEQVLVSDSDLLDGVVQYLASKGGIHDPSVGT